MTTYTIQGRRIRGILATRLDEARTTGINDLPGVVVYDAGQVFYAEAFKKGNTIPVSRKEMGEALQGLVELTTKERTSDLDDMFTVTKELP